MEIKSCLRCRKLVINTRDGLCPECLEIEKEAFLKVREYIKNNKGADLNTTAEETGVSISKIMKYLREGKLEVDNNSGFLRCEKCGEGISSGRFCKKCSNELSKGLTGLFVETKEVKKPVTAKMHIRRD